MEREIESNYYQFGILENTRAPFWILTLEKDAVSIMNRYNEMLASTDYPGTARPLRILHIGNIANNAFLMAKLQNKVGMDAFVISPDFTHVMGYPAWEEYEFSINERDHFNINSLGIDPDIYNYHLLLILDNTQNYLISLQSPTNDHP